MKLFSGRVAGRVVVSLTLLVGLVACNPKFPDSAFLRATPEGDGVRLVWSPADVTYSVETIASYRVDVDGVDVARIDASSTSCLLSGLASGADHEVAVTAYDSSGHRSTDSVVAASVTGPAGSSAGEIGCVVADLPASISVAVSQPTPGAGTKLIGGQIAPVDYELAVSNMGETPSGEVVVTDPVPVGTTLVDDSASCGEVAECTVEVVDAQVRWTLTDIAVGSTSKLSFSVTVNPDQPDPTEITNTASFTNVATPGCDTDTCTTNTVSNPAEPWKWISTGIAPRNSIFFSGYNKFDASGFVTNDPAATMSYYWDCIPSSLCVLTEASEDHYRVTYNLIWDDIENVDFLMIALAIARQGPRTLRYQLNNPFRLDEASHYNY